MRKDYQFPAPMPLTKRLEDILEPEVNERYFLKDDAVSKFLKANDKDTALFHQFPLPPTHEDAMFLKTWLTLWCEHNMAWEKMTPTEMDEHLTRCTPDLKKVYDQWKQTGTFPSEEFKGMFEENMKHGAQ